MISMDPGTINPVRKAAGQAWKPQDRRKVWEWCEENVYAEPNSPMPGKWRSDNSPWAREFLEEWSNNAVREIAVMCSAQSSKTSTILCGLMWSIAEDPGPAMWVTSNAEQAQEDVRDRFAPSFQRCKAVKNLIIEKKVLDFQFTSMPLYFIGAGSEAKLQSKPIRWLILDEVRNYPEGAVETVQKRTRAFWNSRKIIISTPGNVNDAVHRAYLAGDQRVYHASCPKCHALQALKFQQLVAVHPETGERCRFGDVPGAVDGQTWNFDALADHIRYQCVSCGYMIRDTPSNRKWMAKNGRFIRTNPKAPRNRVSFHWNALLPFWVTWRSIVEEFLLAQDAARKGDVNPLRIFVTETLGEPWEDRLGEIDDFGFLDARKDAYGFGDEWPEEQTRFMAADKQAKGGEHYWWVVRAFSRFGGSRLVAYGRCNTYAELEERRIQYGVSKKNAAIDSGFKASEVYRFCLSTGWKAFKGDDAEWFIGRDLKTGKPVRRSWDISVVDAGLGLGTRRQLPLYRWSNPKLRDLLGSMMTGLVQGWSIPKEVARDYLKQLSAHVREEVRDALGRAKYVWRQRYEDDHLADCEMMILVMAVICGLVQGEKRGSPVATGPSNRTNDAPNIPKNNQGGGPAGVQEPP